MKVPACQHQFDRLGGKCIRCGVFQRELVLGPLDDAPSSEQIIKHASAFLEDARKKMAVHYRNGREAKNGDKVVQIGDRYNADGSITKGVITGVGVLYDAKPGNDFCNGNIAPIQQQVTGACMCDCLHVDDVAAFLAEKGLDKRPAGK